MSDEELGGGFLHTFGNSRAAINLMGNILGKQEYPVKRKVLRLMSKQANALTAIMDIRDTTVREATLEMWHKRFATLLYDLPEVVKTHVLCVETGVFRKLLSVSSRR